MQHDASSATTNGVLRAGNNILKRFKVCAPA